MSGYDSKKFSREFSKRTINNLQFIDRCVDSAKDIEESHKNFSESCIEVLTKYDELISRLRMEAHGFGRGSKNDKKRLTADMFSIAGKLEDARKSLLGIFERVNTISCIPGDRLYEVTQLINSLMGIAVLPYEMHKELFDNIDDEKTMIFGIR